MKKLIVLLLAFILIVLSISAAAADGYMIITPNGAPAIAVAGVWAENPDAVITINADTIAEAFGSGEADFIIAPINAGAKLYKAGKSTYRLAAVVTWGNLVFASRTETLTPSTKFTACLAAIMTFPLFGMIITFLALHSLIALTNVSVEGFIV